MTVRRAGLAVAGALLAVGSAACKSEPAPRGSAPPVRVPDGGLARPAAVPRQPETALVTSVDVRRGQRGESRPIDSAALSRRLGQLLTASPAFLAEDEAEPAGRVAVPARIAVTVHQDVSRAPPDVKATGARGAIVAVVGVEAEVEWKASGDRLQPRENVLVERALDGKEEQRLDRLVAELAAQAIDQAGQGLVAKESLRQGDDAQVVAALGSDDVDLVSWALDLAAQRRLAAAFDAAASLLDARDPGVQTAAVRALVELRDPRAVAELARRADFADPDTMRTLVEAVTAIGGSEAIAFLEMVAGGHADRDLRKRAEEGLERLGRRQERRSP